MPTYAVLGADLALTRDVGAAASAPLGVADSWGSVDLAVRPGRRTSGRDRRAPVDLGRVEGRENLAQALVLRLLTPAGSLAQLGHPGYGSRLGELTGRLNDDTTRNLARLFTIEAVRQEPRVAEVLELAVRASSDQPNVLTVGLSVRPVDDGHPLALALEVTL